MKDHKIEVKVKPGGDPDCAPNETPQVKRGDRLIWSGPKHSGKFEGKILGPKQSGFTAADLKTVEVDATKIPTDKGIWSSDHPILTIRQDAENGAYKYSVTSGGKTVDPVVIVEDGLE